MARSRLTPNELVISQCRIFSDRYRGEPVELADEGSIAVLILRGEQAQNRACPANLEPPPYAMSVRIQS